jgi:hypothetical protein
MYRSCTFDVGRPFALVAGLAEQGSRFSDFFDWIRTDGRRPT